MWSAVAPGPGKWYEWSIPEELRTKGCFLEAGLSRRCGEPAEAPEGKGRWRRPEPLDRYRSSNSMDLRRPERAHRRSARQEQRDWFLLLLVVVELV